jgi:hypothetical protein
MGNYRVVNDLTDQNIFGVVVRHPEQTVEETMQADGWKDASGTGELWWKKPTLLDAHAKQVESEDAAVKVFGSACNPHPDAPHGFCRDASHSAGRYVCECEGWSPNE